MSVLLSWTLSNGSAQSATLDASISEGHQTLAQVTEHQVEKGVNIADHIRPMPKRISIEGVLTNYPITQPADYANGVQWSQQKSQQSAPNTSPLAIPAPPVSFTTLQAQGTVDRAKALYADLVVAELSGLLFTVTTSLAQYKSMAIVNLNAPRSADDSTWLRFTIELQEVRVVSTTTVEVAANTTPEKVTRGNKGKKPNTKLDPQKDQQKESFAYGLLE